MTLYMLLIPAEQIRLNAVIYLICACASGDKRYTDPQDTNDDRIEFIEVGPNVVRTTGAGEERLENPIELSAVTVTTAIGAGAGTGTGAGAVAGTVGLGRHAKLSQPKDHYGGAIDNGNNRHNLSQAAAWSVVAADRPLQFEPQQTARSSGADRWRPSEAPQPSHARSAAAAPTWSASLSSTTTTSDSAEAEADQLARAYLDTGSMVTDITAHIGGKAYLVCRLRASKAPLLVTPSSSSSNHQQRREPLIGFDSNNNFNQYQQEQLQVSWVRDMQILTSGTFRYTSDDRFKPQHLANAREWALEIDGVRASDAGTYDCQVNSEPKSARLSFRLNVISASLRLHEGDKVRANEGDRIRLTCEVSFARAEPDADTTAAAAAAAEASVSDSDSELVESSRQHGTAAQVPTASGESTEDDDNSVIRTRRQVNTNANQVAAGRWPAGTHLQQQAQHYIYWYKDGTSLGYNVPYGRVRVEPKGARSPVGEYSATGTARAPIGNLLSVLAIDGASGDDSALYSCALVPELADVRPAQVHVLVGSGGGRYESGSNSVNNGLYIGTGGGSSGVFGECSAKHFMLIAIASATTSILLLIKFT